MKLIQAILANDTARVWRLLGKGADISATSEKGMTALHAAVLSGNAGMIRLVQQHLFSRIDAKGLAPIHYAAWEGNARIGLMLIRGRIEETGHRDPNGQTPLHMAAANGRTDFVRLLLKLGVDASVSDHQDNTPLYYACENGHREIAELLLKAKADPLAACGPRGNVSPMHVAAYNNDVQLLELCLKHGGRLKGNVPILNARPLIEAALRGGAEAVSSFLLKNDAARLHFHSSEPGAIPWANARSFDWRIELFCRALSGGMTALALSLVEAGMDVDFWLGRPAYLGGRSPLCWALAVGNVKVVDALLKKGADPNISEKKGEDIASWPMSIAVRSGIKQGARLLIAHGARDVSHKAVQALAKMDEVATLLEEHRFDDVDRLLKQGLLVHGILSSGENFMSRACEALDMKVLAFLIDRGADVNQRVISLADPAARGSCLQWPLGIALANAQNTDFSFIKRLISNGARIDLIPRRGSNGEYYFDEHVVLLRRCFDNTNNVAVFHILGSMGVNICGILKLFLDTGSYAHVPSVNQMLYLMKGTGLFVEQARTRDIVPAHLCVLGMLHGEPGIFSVLEPGFLKARYPELPDVFLKAAASLLEIFRTYVDKRLVSLKTLAALAVAIMEPHRKREGARLPRELEDLIVGEVVESQGMLTAAFLRRDGGMYPENLTFEWILEFLEKNEWKAADTDVRQLDEASAVGGFDDWFSDADAGLEAEAV